MEGGMQMKIAILGSGSIVPDFIEAANQVEQMELYGIWGRESSAEKLQNMQKQYQIPHVFYDYEKLLADPQIDAVYIALPNYLHYEYAKKALLAKKHVIVEKPFTATFSQAESLIMLARQQGVVVFDAVSNQYMPNFYQTKECIKSLGDIKIVQMNYSQYSRRYDLFKQGTVLPVFDPKQAGGALMDINVYNIHFILGLFGKPNSVHYYANIERGIDTSGILTLLYDSFQCVAVGAKDCQAPLSINIQGDKGYLHSQSPANAYESFQCGMNQGEPQTYSLNQGKPRLYYELEFFANLVISQDITAIDAVYTHTLAVMEVLEEAREQAGIIL